ncbi:EAL domain-containing protein [Solirubrobacter phytolaccae]|uniref:EAL domain-containing protein n=1 Tax=Solirubrobacter phytolaccae TaxID=1404360 RepID=A0A9X3N9U7_9ACTN|nr:EAL domain-containing protein [Solirubrobacter phytolaccae]MDA0182056.1 EAL domain-containing protein [Solirubrobacter phytolaccae]
MLRSAKEERALSTCDIGADGVVRTWSRAATRLFGHEADQIVGRHVRALLPDAPLRPDTAVETVAVRADGERIALAVRFAATDEDGTLACRAHEVAHRREPAVLRADLAAREFATDAVVSADRAGHVIGLNPAAERLLGCTLKSALGCSLAEVLGDETLPEQVLSGHPVHTEQTRTPGQLTLISALPLRDHTGEVVGATAIFSDVTAQRGAAAAREREEREARQIERTSRALAESLDLDATLKRAAETFVPDLADLCVIFSLEPDGKTLTLRAAEAADAEVREFSRRAIGMQRPLEAHVEGALVTGQRPYLHGHRSMADEPPVVAAKLGDVWRTALPLRSNGGVWGLLVLGRSDRRPEPDARELRLMTALADRAGQALENARLHAQSTQARERFTAAFEHAPIGMALADATGVITEANPELAQITGLAQLVGARLPELYDPNHVGAEETERPFARPDGETVWVQVRVAPAGAHVVLLVQDITDRKRHESQLQYLADHDALTGLYNRRRFAEELDWVLAYSRRYRSPSVVIAVDVDNFKFVNDTYGHATGDALLVAIAEALRARCRNSDIVGRLGGDEFGVVLPHSGKEEADIVAQALLEAVRDGVRVPVGERTVRATASIGVRLIGPETEQTAEEILSDADIALYDAKESGRDRLSVTGDGSAVTDRLRARIGWSDRIRDALHHDGFALHEQPILHIGNDQVESSELLLRMCGDDGGLIAPGAFLEIAERFGQIQAIDRWVLGRALELLAARHAAGLHLDVEVNLSGGSISDPGVIDFIVAEVRNAPIDPRCLTIEVTETAAITNLDRARALATSLADLGCRFALDDFGSGFGSFYYLKHLPFDVVKIDGEFIRELEHSHADRLTVQAIVHIARGLGKPTIAEFVERDATLRLLGELGVDYAQGYHVGRPQPVELRPSFLRDAGSGAPVEPARKG